LSYEVRLFFQGLWCSADKAGRLEDRPKKLKVQILPYDNLDAEKMLSILAKPKNGNSRAFIIRYEVDNEKYIQIVNWDKHQKPHHTEKDSTIPPNTPLKTKRKIKIKIKQNTASSKLDNGVLTVKDNAYPFLKDKDFFKAFSDYLDMRVSIKKKATQGAIELRLKDLHKYDIKTAIAMIENSIMNSYQGIFELKNKLSNSQQTKLQKDLGRIAEFGEE